MNEFPCADVHELIAPDLLHQVIKGSFKDHLVMWVEELLLHIHHNNKAKVNQILDDIDRWYVSSYHAKVYTFTHMYLVLPLLRCLLVFIIFRRVETSSNGQEMIRRPS